MEISEIIKYLKDKYPNEDLSGIITYYQNIKNETNLDSEQVTSFYNVLSIIDSNPNIELLDDFFNIEYQRFCQKYGKDVIEGIIGGKVR